MFKKISKFLLFLCCFCLVPAAVIIFSIEYKRNSNENEASEAAMTVADEVFREISIYTSPEAFWNGLLARTLSDVSEQTLILETLEKLKSDFGISYFAYFKNRKESVSTIDEVSLEDAKIVGDFILNNVTKRYYDNVEKKTLATLDKVFGPQFIWVKAEKLLDGESDTAFILGDAHFRKPLFWMKRTDSAFVCVAISNELILASLKHFSSYLASKAEKQSKVFMYALLSSNGELIVKGLSESYREELKEAVEILSRDKTRIAKTSSLIVYPLYLNSELTVLAFRKNSYNEGRDAVTRKLLYLLLFFIVAVVAYRGFKVLVLSYPDTMSLTVRIYFLFMLVNALPLLVVFFITRTYPEKFYREACREKLSEAVSFLQEIDTKLLSERKRHERQIKKTQENMIFDIRNGLTFSKAFEKFCFSLSELEPSIFLYDDADLFLVYDKYRIYRDKDLKNKLSDTYLGLKWQIVQGLRQFYFNAGTPKTYEEQLFFIKFSYLLESIHGQTLNTFVLNLLENKGRLGKVQLMDYPALMYYDSFESIGEKLRKMGLICYVSEERYIKRFLSQNIDRIERNEDNFKILIYNQENKSFLNAGMDMGIEEALAFAAGLGDFPSDRVEFCSLNGDKHLVTGIKGTELSGYSLLALYPIALFSAKMQSLKLFLLLMMIGAAAVSAVLARALALTFLSPLREVTTGIRAMEEQRFDFRLPVLQGREFYNLGRAFNNMMEDLGELSSARAIQNELLPKPQTKIGDISFVSFRRFSDNFAVDYYDFFTSGEGIVALLASPVSSGGVYAALLMSMLKAGIMPSAELHSQPPEILKRLNLLICASKLEAARKLVNFQYLFFEKNSKKFKGAFAGENVPLLIKLSEKKVFRLNKPSAMLGYYEETSFYQYEGEFASGDILLFYSPSLLGSFDADKEKELSIRFFEEFFDKEENFLEKLKEFLENEVLRDNSSLFVLKRDD